MMQVPENCVHRRNCGLDYCTYGVDCPEYKAKPKTKADQCKYCTLPEEYIGVSAYADTRLFIGVSGTHLRLFDEEYPGYIDDLPINNCPMCGRELTE